MTDDYAVTELRPRPTAYTFRRYIPSYVLVRALFRLILTSLSDIQSSSDIPLLVSLRALAHRLLTSHTTPIPPLSASLQVPYSSTGLQTPLPHSPFPPSSPSPLRPSSPFSSTGPGAHANTHTPAAASSPQFHIGFITPPWKDNKIPVKDHLHAHAYVEPLDLAGWWRGMAYGPLAWYSVDDLIAEIR